MAIFVFTKNSNNVVGALYRIAENQTIYDDNKNWDDSMYDLVTVNDSDFNSVKLNNKSVVSKNGDTVSYEDNNWKYNFSAGLKKDIDSRISVIETWLKGNSSKPMASSVTTYLNYLKGLDATSIITDPSSDATYDDSNNTYSDGTPLNMSLEAYANSQGQTVYNFLQLL